MCVCVAVGSLPEVTGGQRHSMDYGPDALAAADPDAVGKRCVRAPLAPAAP